MLFGMMKTIEIVIKNYSKKKCPYFLRSSILKIRGILLYKFFLNCIWLQGWQVPFLNHHKETNVITKIKYHEQYSLHNNQSS